MPRVTALRELRAGRVAVELEGVQWRTLPAEVVARAGLCVHLDLDRPHLRLLRHELRRFEAVDTAGRALRRQDLSRRRLSDRLQRAGVAPADRAETLDTLARLGILDDARLARSRAAALADRGYGDAAIRFDLERQGIAGEEIEAALRELEPEIERAPRVAARFGGGTRAARALARRGFGEDAFEAALRAVVADEP